MKIRKTSGAWFQRMAGMSLTGRIAAASGEPITREGKERKDWVM